MVATAKPDAYWSRNANELARSIGAGATGLTQGAASAQLQKTGPNSVEAGARMGTLRLLLRQFESPLVLILIFAAIVSVLVGEYTEATIILLIVAGSTLLSFSQEYRASTALANLRGRLGLKTTALRDGQPLQIPVTEVVPGDVLLLTAGNLIPADGVAIDARDFLVSQAALTGESFPVEKRAEASPADAALSERTNMLLQGTSVRSGTATMLVVNTGHSTVFGGIAQRLGAVEDETDFERGIRKFGYLLTKVMTIIVTLVFAANVYFQRPLIDSLLFSVALAVGLTPELLPAIVSVTMAAGARRMAKRGVIVRRTAAIENLGSIDVLCTDKTGTLTQGTVELNGAMDPDGIVSENVFSLALINAHLETGIENPLDAAIVAAAKARGSNFPEQKKIDEIPYDFQRKRLTIVVDLPEEAGNMLVTKGAFDTVIACCTEVATVGGRVPLDQAGRDRLQSFYALQGEVGFRVLGVATRRMPATASYSPADEVGMVFEGFLLFFDPLKPGIAETLADLTALGIAVKVITGDNRHVAAHVGEAAGLGKAILTGADLARTRDEALWHLAETTDIFAEIDPQQKERIVRALQHRGHSVAYMGDGINDAPALRAADVGISVDQAVDVARESADIVMLEQDLDVLRQGVIDGRRTFANTLKYISITTSANFGNMISMAIGTLFLPFLPLLASQILLNNFLSDFPSIAISTDNVDAEDVANAPRWNIRRITAYMVVFGLVSTVFDLLTFLVLIKVFRANENIFQTSWFLISLLTELAVVLVLRTRRPAWKSAPGRVLAISTIVVFMLSVGLIYAAPAASLVGLVALPWHLLLSAFGIVFLYIATTEIAKRAFYRRMQA